MSISDDGFQHVARFCQQHFSLGDAFCTSLLKCLMACIDLTSDSKYHVEDESQKVNNLAFPNDAKFFQKLRPMMKKGQEIVENGHPEENRPRMHTNWLRNAEQGLSDWYEPYLNPESTESCYWTPCTFQFIGEYPRWQMLSIIQQIPIGTFVKARQYKNPGRVSISKYEVLHPMHHDGCSFVKTEFLYRRKLEYEALKRAQELLGTQDTPGIEFSILSEVHPFTGLNTGGSLCAAMALAFLNYLKMWVVRNNKQSTCDERLARYAPEEFEEWERQPVHAILKSKSWELVFDVACGFAKLIYQKQYVNGSEVFGSMIPGRSYPLLYYPLPANAPAANRSKSIRFWGCRLADILLAQGDAKSAQDTFTIQEPFLGGWPIDFAVVFSGEYQLPRPHHAASERHDRYTEYLSSFVFEKLPKEVVPATYGITKEDFNRSLHGCSQAMGFELLLGFYKLFNDSNTKALIHAINNYQNLLELLPTTDFASRKMLYHLRNLKHTFSCGQRELMESDIVLEDEQNTNIEDEEIPFVNSLISGAKICGSGMGGCILAVFRHNHIIRHRTRAMINHFKRRIHPRCFIYYATWLDGYDIPSPSRIYRMNAISTKVQQKISALIKEYNRKHPNKKFGNIDIERFNILFNSSLRSAESFNFKNVDNMLKKNGHHLSNDYVRQLVKKMKDVGLFKNIRRGQYIFGVG